MSLSSGRVSFCRFTVTGSNVPRQVTQELLETLTKNAFADTPIGAPGEIESGWTAGGHLLDQQFSFEKNVFGSMLYFALRIDTHKVPSDLKNAYRKVHEAALAAQNPSGFASRDQKRQAREEADAQVHDDLAQGKFRRSRQVEVLWDLVEGMLYCASTASKAHEQLAARFRASFDLSLEYQSSGRLAAAILHQTRRQRDWEDLRPSPFTATPDAARPEADDAGRSSEPIDLSIPSVPWTVSGTDLKDFLGNEFLLWLWHHALHHEGQVEVPAAHGRRNVSVMLDRALDMDCAWGATGKQSLRGSGPTQMKEAREALRQGKWPRKVGMIVADADGQWEFSLQADQWQIGSVLLPEIQEAETPRQLMEQRLESLCLLARTLEGMYQTFLDLRTGSRWIAQRDLLREWIRSRRA